MINYLLVGLGAACGGALRYGVYNLLKKIPFGFPLATLSVNIVGSFLLGFLIFAFDVRKIMSAEVKLMLTTGLCGGFTTFSTFSVETIHLIKGSQYALAGLNVGLNIVCTLLAVLAAHSLAKVIN